MPGHRTHLLSYACAALSLSHLLVAGHPLPAGEACVAFLVGAVAALAPDMDCRSSLIHQLALRMLLTTAAVSLVLLAAGYGRPLAAVAGGAVAAALALGRLRHRGILHHPLAGVCLSIPLLAVNPVYAVSAAVGYTSHTLLDALA